MKRVLLLLSAACSQPAAPEAWPLSSDGTHLRDAVGRIALLRGVNVRAQGVFDVTFDDGRTALEAIPEITQQDFFRMRELGFTLVRLPINWSALAPERGTLDEPYLDRVNALVDEAALAELFVLIDIHQDAYSKEIGEDGAPLWAIQPPPQMLLQGPLTDLDARRTSPEVTAAFDTFFDKADAAGLQKDFLFALGRVAERWADNASVIGFEIFNEPPVGEDLVDTFQFAAAERVHAKAPTKLVMFEPSAVRNLFDFVPKATAPFPVPNAVYAPHVYTYVFYSDQTQLQNLTADALEPSVEAARAEATAWKTPLLIGEYGIGPTMPNADMWMGVEAELHDRFLASDAFWLWKEESQGSWGVFDVSGSTWTERPQVIQWISRVHASRIAGDVIGNTYNYTTGALTLEVKSGSTHGQPHTIYIPERAARTYTVTCDNVALATTRDDFTGIIAPSCDSVLYVAP